MDRKKQIEEMARIIHEEAPFGDMYRAVILYNAGYRKADEEEIDAIKKGMHFLLYSMCLQLNLEREIFVKYKIQLNNWFENYKKTQNIGAKLDGKEAEAKIK